MILKFRRSCKIAGGLGTLFILMCCPRVYAQAFSGPDMVFEERKHDFGFLTQGKKVEHVFRFKNNGDVHLIIDDIKTSCGCTAAVLSDKTIAPGSEGEILVRFDSRGKFGRFVKKIYIMTNVQDQPIREIEVSGEVEASAHPEMTGTISLFQGDCRTCHVERGVGKKAEALYQADCAMCHEHHLDGEHFIAPSKTEMQGHERGYLSDSIRNGIENKSMPAFHRDHGGPLGDIQIQTLVDFIKGN